MTDRILKALGAKDEHEALRAIAEVNEFMASVKTATGRETYAGALEVIGNGVSLVREMGTITEEAESAKQLGMVLAWKSSHGALPAATAKISELEDAGRARDVAALIKEGLAPNSPENRHGGKLTPATAKYWENEPAAKLAAFLEIAPRVLPGELRQERSGDVKLNAVGAATDEEGNAWEDIKPAKRAAMQKSDPDLYNALRGDWVKRGEPASKPKTAAA